MAQKVATKQVEVPTDAPRTLEQIVTETMETVTPLGVGVTFDRLEARYAVIGANDISGEVERFKAVVTSEPIVYDDRYEKFEPRFPGHVGTVLFAIAAIEERKLDSLELAFEEFGEDGVLDLAYVSKLTMRVEKLLTENQPDPGVMPMKGMEIDILCAIAQEKVDGEFTGEAALDELGQKIVNVVKYSVPAPKAARRFKRRTAINTAEKADTTPSA